MTNNDNNDIDNDLDVDNFDDGAGFDDFSKKGTLGDLWRNNPMVKIGVILAGFAVVVGAIILFGGGDERPPMSSVETGSSVNQAPGTEAVSRSMQDSIEQKNIENTEEALRNNESVMPIPIEPSKSPIPVPMDEVSGEDPLDRWRRMQEERVRQQEMLAQTQPGPEVQAPPVDTKTPAVNALSQSMVSQMGAILGNQPIKGPSFKKITSVGYLQDLESKRMGRIQQQQQLLASSQVGTNEVIENIILPAGTIEYGQLLIEANTDAPGPVLAQIMSGPLRGSRVLGSFQSTDKYLTLQFGQIVIDGISYPIQAVAIDPGTTLPGLITEIDNRYFTRIVLPMAAEFITGLTEAISESGTTSVFISDSSVTQSSEDKDSGQEVASGISEAGDRLSEILDEKADNTQPMLRLANGTPIGLLFVAPVIDQASYR